MPHVLIVVCSSADFFSWACQFFPSFLCLPFLFLALVTLAMCHVEIWKYSLYLPKQLGFCIWYNFPPHISKIT